MKPRETRNEEGRGGAGASHGGRPARPGPSDYASVLGLLAAALWDAAILPFRLAIFLLRRKRTESAMRRLIESQKEETR
jgi:hypothetical protein